MSTCLRFPPNLHNLEKNFLSFCLHNSKTFFPYTSRSWVLQLDTVNVRLLETNDFTTIRSSSCPRDDTFLPDASLQVWPSSGSRLGRSPSQTRVKAPEEQDFWLLPGKVLKSSGQAPPRSTRKDPDQDSVGHTPQHRSWTYIFSFYKVLND